MSDKVPQVYAAMAAVMAELAVDGVGKDRKNEQQNYRFRGVDDVYNALAPLLARHKLVVLPRVLARSVTERTTQKGGMLQYVVVDVEFDFVSAVDGSTHTARTLGEAMDSADKATNKAMSAAYKYVMFMALCIPTEGTGHDSEEDHPQPKPRPDMVATGRHPSYTDAEGKGFAIGIGKLGLTYDALADWLQKGAGTNARTVLETLELPPSRPSQWATRYRKALYSMIEKDPASFIRSMQADETAPEYGS